MLGLKVKYDAEGNRIAKGDIKYEWDHRNRLVKVETPQETVEYTYDYQNRLVKRSVGKNITHFIHDGWQIVRQCENGKPVKRFLWGTKQDELLCDNDNWTLGDHLNTIREVVNSDGKVIAHCDYNAFGKCLSPLKDLSFAYTGKLIDNTTGLQWNINRWYDSSVGRWISEDPIGFEGKDENLVRYVKNYPLDARDIYGLWKYVSGMGTLSGSLGISEDQTAYGDASSSFRLEFNNNKEKFKTKCCDMIKFIQIYYADFNTLTFLYDLVKKQWTIDADNGNYYYPNGVWISPKFTGSSMTDDPFYGALSRYTSTTIGLDLEVCAVCSKGENNGEVYACLQ